GRRGARLQPERPAPTDGELLAAFVERGSEVAFGELLRRHGPMVWGVCRRVTADHHDAEDAFQVSFLVLVRKGATVLPRELVGNWLYGVAYQTALKARALAARRKAREKQVTMMPEAGVATPEPEGDLRELLDRELSRLPEKYRAALVLCDLQGRPRKEVARQLGVPEGTVAARLARSRQMLARRLARYGLVVSMPALTAILSQTVLAALPASVACSAVRLGSLLALGEATSGVPRLAALEEGVLKAMFPSKLKLVAA